jgi:exonuclease I
MKTFYWYDFETFGINPKTDRIYRGVNDMNIYGLSVRCIKDANKTPYPAYTPWR